MDAAETGFDFKLYKKFYDIWTRTSTEMLDELMHSPQYAEMAGKALENSADLKKQVDEVIEASLKNMHLPTSSDVKGLSRRLRTLEERFQQVVQKMEMAQSRSSIPPKRPTGRRKR